MDMQQVIEWINKERDRASRELKETQRIGGHSCYGAGVEWGQVELCERLLDFINGNE